MMAPSSTVSSSRSSSPVKVAALRALSTPVDFITLPLSSHDDPSLPPALATILRKMHLVANGIATIPSHLVEAVEKEQDLVWNPRWQDTRHVAGRTVTLAEIQDLVVCSGEYETRGESEAAWNCSVHARLGEVAVKQSGLEQHLRFSNM